MHRAGRQIDTSQALMRSTTRDYWPTEAWKEAPPDQVGANAEMLQEADREIRVRFRTVNSFLVVKGGYLILERYYNGFDQNDRHPMASVTKSFTSALVGIAIDKGYIESVDQKVLDFFPQFVFSERDCLKRELTVKHLLTMTAGFQWRTGARAYEPLIDRMRRSRDWVQFILNLPIKRDQFGKFQYNSAASHLLSVIVARATSVHVQDFANEHLFQPIGIDTIPAAPQDVRDHGGTAVERGTEWLKDPQGYSIGGWGLAVRPRDAARFGWLYLDYGQWDSTQVISRQWIVDSMKAQTTGTEGYGGYGYQWWLRDVKGAPVCAAVGRGGHHIFCIPEKDVVVVIASKPAGQWRDRWPLLERYIIPAVESPHTSSRRST